MHAFTPLYSPFVPGLSSIFIPVILVVVLWTIILKGLALWSAARGSQKWWFIVLLIVNTLGILEIIYLIWFRPKHSTHASAKKHPSDMNDDTDDVPPTHSSSSAV